MADLNQQNISANLENQVKNELRRRLQKKQQAQRIQLVGRAMKGTGNAGQRRAARATGELNQGKNPTPEQLSDGTNEQENTDDETASNYQQFPDFTREPKSETQDTPVDNETRADDASEENDLSENASQEQASGQQPAEPEIDEDDTARQVNLAQRISKKEGKKEEAQGTEKGIEGVAPEAVNIAGQAITAEALKASWLAIEQVYPLLYINFHFIMKYIVGVRSFCEFGEEWLFEEKSLASSNPVTGKATEKANTSLKWAEIILVFFADVIILTLLVALLMAMYFVASGLFDTVAAVLPT